MVKRIRAQELYEQSPRRDRRTGRELCTDQCYVGSTDGHVISHLIEQYIVNQKSQGPGENQSFPRSTMTTRWGRPRRLQLRCLPHTSGHVPHNHMFAIDSLVRDPTPSQHSQAAPARRPP